MEALAKIQDLLQKRDYYEAGVACESAIRASGESLELLYLRGYALSSQFRFKEATRALRKAVAVKPAVDVIYALAETVYKSGVGCRIEMGELLVVETQETDGCDGRKPSPF